MLAIVADPLCRPAIACFQWHESRKFKDLVLIPCCLARNPFLLMPIFPAISLPACLAGNILSLPAAPGKSL